MNAAKRSVLRYGWSLSALALLLCGAAGSSRAQDVEVPAPKMWSVKAGAFFPTNGTMANATSSSWWSIGVDYYTALRFRPLNADVYISGDYNWRDAGGQSVFTLPITGKLIWNISPAEWRTRIYGGIGAGIWFINIPNSSGTTQPGLTFVAGMDLTDRLFIEANYDWVGSVSNNLGQGMRADGVRLRAGWRY